jgi:hypothetical protein
MKNLNLDAYGVKEMTQIQLQTVNGGFGNAFWFVLGILISELLDRGAPQDFKDGWNDAKDNGGNSNGKF